MPRSDHSKQSCVSCYSTCMHCVKVMWELPALEEAPLTQSCFMYALVPAWGNCRKGRSVKTILCCHHIFRVGIKNDTVRMITSDKGSNKPTLYWVVWLWTVSKHIPVHQFMGSQKLSVILESYVLMFYLFIVLGNIVWLLVTQLQNPKAHTSSTNKYKCYIFLSKQGFIA